MTDERKAVKYHALLVTALRALSEAAEHHAEQCPAGWSLEDELQGARDLLRAIDADKP